MIKKLVTIYEIFIKLEILFDNYKFSILMNNNEIITVFNDKKVICNAYYIDIKYHYI